MKPARFGMGTMNRTRTKHGVTGDFAPNSPCIHAAAFGLLEKHPELSAGSGLGIHPAIVLGPGSFILAWLLIAPQMVLWTGVGVLSLYVLSVSLLRLAAALAPDYASPRQALCEGELPPATVIVAMYNEAKVLPGLHASLQRLDYPRDRLQVIFALEASDTETIAAARGVARRGAVELLVLPECGPRTKPRALNAALQIATGQVVVVYDAEDAPHPDQLRHAAEAFAANSKLGVIQAPLNWYNGQENWLTQQFALEYAAQFEALLPFMARLGWPLPLGGTSNVFSRKALDACGGWDPFNVTEDADLGFRLSRYGWQAGVIKTGTREEAPITRPAWTAQRSRWLKGHLVSWLVQMRDPRGLIQATGLGGFACAQLTLLANALSAGLHAPGLVLWLLGFISALSGEAGLICYAALLSGLAAYLAAMVCAATGAYRAPVPAPLSTILTMPIYWLLQLPALLRALRELVHHPYVWAKTRHGVSTARRVAPDDPAPHPDRHGRMRSNRRPGRLALKPTR